MCPLCFRVLLRVRMLYYIKHEIIGDLVQHISDGVHVRFVKKTKEKNKQTTSKIETNNQNRVKKRETSGYTTMLRLCPSPLFIIASFNYLRFVHIEKNREREKHHALTYGFIQCFYSCACAMYSFHPWDLFIRTRGMTP